MLGSVPLSTKALGDDTILLAGVAEMTALGVQTSVGSGTLVGEASLSANFTQTTAGIYISGSAAVEMSANFTETSAAVRVLGYNGLSLSANFTQTSTATGTFVGASSQSVNFTQTSTGSMWEVVGSQAANDLAYNASFTNLSNLDGWSTLSTTATTENWSDFTSTHIEQTSDDWATVSTTATTENWSDLTTQTNEEHWNDLTR